MSDVLDISYPLWFILLCAGIGAVYAFVLYWRDRELGESGPGVRRALPFFAFLRFSVVTLLALLLLDPVLRYRKTETEKPLILIAEDDSGSLQISTDSAELAAIGLSLDQLDDDLGRDFEVRRFHFGESLEEAESARTGRFSQPATNLSSALDLLYDRFANRNVGAVVLATDGIFNVGANPAYGDRRLPAPIYSVALGDTSVRRDLRIDRTYCNRIVYLGDRFSLRVDLSASHAKGASSTLSVDRIEGSNRRNMGRQSIRIDSDPFSAAEEFVFEADRAGIMHLQLRLNSVEGEVTTANNIADVYVDVLDARQKVLLLAQAPHPDISAIRQVLQGNRNYELDYQLARDFPGNLAAYDLVILHQLPSPSQSLGGVLESISRENVPTLFILGQQSDLDAFNSAQGLLKIRGGNGSVNEVQALRDPDFSLFKLDENLQGGLRRFPPVQAPFGEYNSSPEANILLRQRIGSVETNFPLLSFGQQSGRRVAVMAAEGLWRWRLYDYLDRGDHNRFEELLGKSLQYLSVKSDRRSFRCLLSKNLFNEKERVVFQAELYNDNYEAVNDPDVDLEVSNQAGERFDFRFNRRGDGYYLDAGSFEPGEYSYEARTIFNGKGLSSKGRFTVSALQLEAIRVTADHGLLAELSGASGGSLLYPNRINELAGIIRANNEIRPVLHESLRTRSVINLKWIFFLLLGLLGLEWFLRKWSGGY